MDSAKYELPRDIYLAETKHSSYSDLWTILKAVECRVLKITYFLNYKKANALLDVRNDVTEFLEHLTKASKISGFVKPRLFLLKAYMNVIRGRMNKAKKLVGVALRNAHNQENLLMQASIELHRKAWFDNYSATNIHWIELANQEERVDWHDVCNLSNVDYMSIMYCLPKPENHL
ncbi:uncharacterized protein LOC124294417 [Neodiprion lecontei]|uniref:Uncharacterized protein LOC124294417 n=1 Tax=Neodiprion lecontei TaxID=441921 RepID=A0ABM3G503_NEOLC|nr:uncharacterized protein LOC124294417 [Neodiprion lecontei]